MIDTGERRTVAVLGQRVGAVGLEDIEAETRGSGSSGTESSIERG